jgi:lipopolysaccharide/colanic/teichoic acid biosynthesis glycosyltransferase
MTTIEWWMRLVKRWIDVIWSLVWLIIFSPLFIIVAIAIKLNSQGPVFYRQERIGKWWKPFWFFKFRSMYRDDCIGEWYGGETARAKRQALIHSPANIRPGILQKIVNDPRVTSVWRFIRATSIDELPSLWCVLVGDMSLVWPRPHMPHEVAQYTNWHKKLFTVKPWITWYAQIHGRDKQDFDAEAQYDITYIYQWSLLLDIYILVRTVTVLFVGRWK